MFGQIDNTQFTSYSLPGDKTNIENNTLDIVKIDKHQNYVLQYKDNEINIYSLNVYLCKGKGVY